MKEGATHEKTKQTQTNGPARRSSLWRTKTCKTKPIFSGLQSLVSGLFCKTKPIDPRQSSRPGLRAWIQLVKTNPNICVFNPITRIVRKTKPISFSILPLFNNLFYKTKPMSAKPPCFTLLKLQNKPNFLTVRKYRQAISTRRPRSIKAGCACQNKANLDNSLTNNRGRPFLTKSAFGVCWGAMEFFFSGRNV